ncbi:MAG: response regulator [Candidatus Brocadiia bacterium]
MAKILYVDADGDRTESVRRLLAGMGHLVIVARSAERAMIRVDQESDFDAVLLHLILPGMDGAELCRWLERWSRLARVPRVVFTGPETRLSLGLEDRLPPWLPADQYLHCVSDFERIAGAVQSVLSPPENGRAGRRPN